MMLNIPEEIKNLFRADNSSITTQKRFALTFYDDKIESLYPYETLFPSEDLFPAEHDAPWLVIENDRIETESLTITEALSETEDLEFGSCESTMMEIIVADVIEDITGREFELSVEIGDYKMLLGIFTVQSFVRQADRRKRKITAYDRMQWFDVDVAAWYNDLTFPMTIRTFRNSLCDYIGIRQEQTELVLDELEISKTIEPKEISGLDIMKAICQINGCFGNVDKLGEIRYIRLQRTGLYPSEDLFPDEELFPAELGGYGDSVEIVSTYKQMTYEDYLVEGISGLSIRQEEGDIGANVGSGENSYAIEGNFLVFGKSAAELLQIAETLLPQIEGRVYKPSVLECVAMPWVEVGDAVRAITKDDLVDTFVIKRVTSGCQAMMDTIEATGAQKREEVFGIHKQIIQLEGKSAIITKDVEEVSVRVTNLKEQEEAHFKITSEAIEAEVTRATSEEEKLSGRITVNATNITAEVTRATKAEGELSGRITIESDRITAEVTRASKAEGELSGRITVNAENINLKVSKGQVSSEISVESGGVNISGGRLTVDSTNFKLKGNGDVTVTGTINANKGKIGGSNGFTIDANKMYSGSKSSLSSTANGVYVGTDGISLGNNKFKVTNTGNIIAVSGTIAKYTLSDNDLISGNVGMSSVTTSGAVSFWAGNSNRNSAPFRVTNQGKMYASNAEISGKITAKSGQIGHWTIDENGLVGDRGSMRGATISGGHIEGATMDVADGILQVEDGYANSSAIVRLGGFQCSDNYGRSVFQSADEETGMSGDPGQSGGLYLWAGYHGPHNYAFAVNDNDETHLHGDLHVDGDIYLRGEQLSNSEGGSSSKPSSWKVGFSQGTEWDYDWIELVPSRWPSKPSDMAEEDYKYKDAKYLWWYVNINYKNGENYGPDA